MRTAVESTDVTTETPRVQITATGGCLIIPAKTLVQCHR